MGDMTVEELKEKKLCFLWSTKPAKNGKVTKVPFSANGGATGTDDAHKGTWVKFDDAYASKIKFQASGIGLKIPKGFFLLDIDHRDISDAFVQLMPNITPHVCRHTYCSNMAKSGMNPKTLQYLMGHSDISVTMNVYTHIGFDDAEEELKRMEEFRMAQVEIEQKKEKPMSQKMFKVI